MAALCGKKVGASRRTRSRRRSRPGATRIAPASPIQFVGTEGSADARTQLRQGRIDAAVQGNETLPYIMDQEPNAYAPVGEPIATQFTGHRAAGEGRTALQQALRRRSMR